ncbi:hypothetical protein QYF36_007186 [Acer negundo]|nr:hypothetical protein QYF36_007186 [Acer negundo]
MNRVAYTLDMKSLPDARFPHTGQDLQPERVLATLYGCILRRVEQRCKNAGILPPVKERAGGVNSDSIRVFNPAAEMLS